MIDLFSFVARPCRQQLGSLTSNRGYAARAGASRRRVPVINVNRELAQRFPDFQHARPQNWIRPGRPFQANPTFLPPRPIPDRQRSEIYAAFMKDPKTHSVRALSQEHNISMKRIDAILRLKGMEADWIKGHKLQTGFQLGMEWLLAPPAEDDPRNKDEDYLLALPTLDATAQASEGEMFDQDSSARARMRYQRLYWESVPDDGTEPLVPASIGQAQHLALHASKLRKAKLKRLPRIKDTDTIKSPHKRVQVVTKEGRPPVMFVDMGGEFMDQHH
ncbi:eukaryotic mitochondrial regulator protein-domain-containing protein [Mycena floridula]|nr:eukaryotic mitochondrial regulator protein-domain-containing protein [Mycena floridula]